MAISTRTAQQLCNKSEFSLFAASSSNNVKYLSEKEIKSVIARSRKLRDKYRALANRQEREARRKQEPRRSRPSQGSAATRKKEQLFAESLDRFEKQLKKLDAASKKSAKKATSKKATKKTAAKKVARNSASKKKVAKKRTKKKAAAPTRPATQVTRKKSAKKTSATKKATAKAKKTRIQASGKMRKQKHASAQNRRRQSRRDSR